MTRLTCCSSVSSIPPESTGKHARTAGFDVPAPNGDRSDDMRIEQLSSLESLRVSRFLCSIRLYERHRTDQCRPGRKRCAMGEKAHHGLVLTLF
jgi:hypothetical protein